MAPISSSSLSIGTASTVRAPRQLDDRDDDRIAFDVGLLRRDVGDMNHLLGRDRRGRGPRSARRTDHRFTLPLLGKGGRRVMQRARRGTHRRRSRYKCAELGLADAHRVRQHGLEHRLQLAGRTAR